MDEEIEVRQAVKEDLEVCVEILSPRFKFQRNRAEEHMKEKARLREALVAVIRGKPVGVLTYRDRFRGNNIYVEELVVAKDFQHQGVGTKLMGNLIDIGEDKFRLAISLDTE
ncbi:MAG: GNAT family N-acetyltransferase [Candidatus Altiarchaeota archaeon]